MPPPTHGCVELGQTQSRVTWGCLCCKTLFPSLLGVEEPGKLLVWWCPSLIKGVLHSWLSMLGMEGLGGGCGSILHPDQGLILPPPRAVRSPVPAALALACCLP